MDFFIPPRFETEFNIIIYIIQYIHPTMPPKNIFVFNTVVAKLIFCQISRFNTFFVTKAYEVCLSRSDYNLRPQTIIHNINPNLLENWKYSSVSVSTSPHIKAQQSSCSVQGGYAGNAAGMKISSLHKLTDIR